MTVAELREILSKLSPDQDQLNLYVQFMGESCIKWDQATIVIRDYHCDSSTDTEVAILPGYRVWRGRE